MKMQTGQIKRRNGQAMILSVMMLGGVLISIGVIAGILVLYQIRQVNDVENSAKAFFAADAGIEWRTYNIFVASIAPPVFSNGASFLSTSTIADGNIFVRAQGFAADAIRALDSEFVSPLGIENFSATPPSIPAGGSTNLSWNAINASSCNLKENGTVIDASVPLSSSGYAVNPPGAPGATPFYTLTCKDAGEVSLSSDVTIMLTP